jgi:hypothetical protein
MRLIGGLRVMFTLIAAGVLMSACATGVRPVSQSGPAPASRTRPAGPAALAASAAPVADSATSQPGASPAPTPTPTPTPAPTPAPARHRPAAGNPHGHAYVPPAGRAVNTSHPTRVIGHGTPASCTSRAVVAAVARGGVITFSCGPRPVTIKMNATAKVVNTSKRVVLDGGGKVTLSGRGVRRILYMNTCDKRQIWITSHCQDQATPRLTVQNMTFTDGNAAGHGITGGSGGAIYAQGGQFKVINSRFIDNRCYSKGPDLGGAAIRALMQYRNRPVYVVHSTFRGGVCSNGGALSSIAVSWNVLNSVLAHNRAIGWGANPASKGTPGGGSGGAIYNDGDNYHLTVSGTIIRYNHAREGGGAIFFVVDNYHGTLRIEHSTLHHNPNDGFETAGYPGIFFQSSGKPIVIKSIIN